MIAELSFLPDYAFFTLRDPEHDAAVDSAAAIAAARENVAATTGYEIYVCCAQEREPVAVTLADTPPPQAITWQVVPNLRLDCPTGDLRLGDVTGTATATTLPTGPGHYHVDVYHRGRLSSRSPANDDLSQPVERYHLHIRPAQPR
jgi:hypothetical protein